MGHRQPVDLSATGDEGLVPALPEDLTATGTPELDLDETIPVWDINVVDYADHPRVQYYIDYFTTRSGDRFQVWLERLPRYEGMVRERLAQSLQTRPR